jgi:hypothetical protein|tara:strand:- start:8412 stop:8543 length:132 start_codon:yes stop_codon:yes gene_type:complete
MLFCLAIKFDNSVKERAFTTEVMLHELGDISTLNNRDRPEKDT